MVFWNTILLSGQWKVAQYPKDRPDRMEPGGELDFIHAAVPGAVQYDLIEAGKLMNPYASTEAAHASAWVAQSDWLYQKEFSLDMPLGGTGRWFLNIDGVDTFSEIWLNGHLIGETRNNYRRYEFPVESGILKPQENLLMIRVKSHHRMVEGKVSEALDRLGHTSPAIEGLMGKSLIRRYQRSFFSGSSLLNLGTGVLGIGINRPVSLSYYADTRITDSVFRTISVDDSTAHCELQIEIDGPDSEIRAVITNPKTGETVSELCGKTVNGCLTLPVDIQNPRLWWPAGYGEAALYRLHLEIFSHDRCVHSLEKQIGVKTVKLVTRLPNGRDTFYFEVNGKRIWARGQNTIPLDYMKVYGTAEENERFFRLLENANTNLIRVWGGGMPAEDSFYDACDRLGIMLWSEGFLHSNVYPDYDPEFVEEYIAECKEILKLVRGHVSLCIVCGGNEQIEGWEEFGWQGRIERFFGDRLFLKHLPPLVQALCPEIPYIINSPHGGADCQSPVTGECHNWGNYFNAFKDPLFVSETCWSQESYSRPETLEKYMGLHVDDFQEKGWIDRWSKITSRQRIGRLAYSNWPHKDNPSLRRYLHTLELEQARADHHALGLFRLRSPSNNGVIYWSFNKGGPLFQFGCVDYGGYPMMSYYVVARLYRSVVVGLFRDGNEICAVVSNQSGKIFEGTVELSRLRADGTELEHISVPVHITDGESQKVFSSDTMYGKVSDRTREVVFARLQDEKKEVLGEEILFLCPFSEFAQKDASIGATAKPIGDGVWELAIEVGCVMRQLEIESNHKILCSDNYFPLAPGEMKRVRVEILEKIGSEALRLELSTPEGHCKTHLTLS